MRVLRNMALAFGVWAMPLTAWADILPLSEISNYLNRLKTAQADFTQINDDGSISTGVVYIKRPGRVRFEYNPPESALVVAGSNTVVIYDKKSNQPAETYPLRRTPLSLILAERVDLGRARMVTRHHFDGTSTVVTAQDPDNPEYGTLQMKFSADPVALTQWVINGGNGSQTTVVLDEMALGGNLPNRLFDVGQARPGVDR